MRYHVLIRFGKWQDILDEDSVSNDSLQNTKATMLYQARGMAYAALKDTVKAREEQKQFQSYKERETTRKQFFLPMTLVIRVAAAVLEGEILQREGKFDKAFTVLYKAAELDDELPFIEPWGWMMPVRHALGALLLENGRIEQAEQVYRVDLRKNPKNVWSLHGLIEILNRRGENESSEQIKLTKEFKQSSIKSVEIKASCNCRLSVFNNEVQDLEDIEIENLE